MNHDIKKKGSYDVFASTNIIQESMSFGEFLNTLLLKPLQLVFEVIYTMADRIIDSPGLSIIVLSLFMNFLILPLYMRADAIQEEEHALEKKLQKGVDHIKKTFRGDERMMMLQTYYRQNHYKPVYVLRSATSLFLQIPFFMAAYSFLSNLQLLNGVSFGPIQDLSRPDGLLQIAGISVNILPVIMTTINLISCVIFTKGSPWKAKIQLYVMALFFLVFLYGSPSGLVFYWTLNNVFSLVKTIFYKLKNPRKILGVIFWAGGMLLTVYGLFFYQGRTTRKMIFFISIALLLQTPFVYDRLRGKINWKKAEKAENKKLFFGGGIFLAVLTGALIPSTVIKASPQEFIDITFFYNPLWFIAHSLCLATGIFIVWAGVFYFLAKSSVRVYFDKAMWILSGVFIVDYMFFGKNLGMLTNHLKYEDGLEFGWAEQLKNIIVIMVVILIFYIIYRYRDKLAFEVLSIGVLALSCMTAINVININTSVNSIKGRNLENYVTIPRFTLSKTGKNVIVLMLDRAIGEYIPYLFQEKPELEEKFSGFTYYANTISFGFYTNLGSPALFGGYEYTPVEMNKRNQESLVLKQNEALKVMPVLFDQNDYQVTVCDPPYAGYQWIPDLSIYNEYPEIESYILQNKFTDDSIKGRWILDNKRNFFCYGILKSAPLCVQKTIYDYGRYNQSDSDAETIDSKQVRMDMYTSLGVSNTFMDAYNALGAYPEMTDTVEEDINTFLMMTNNTTHEPMLLQEPDYVPAMEVDNTEYEKNHQDRYTINGRTLQMSTDVHAIYYQSNMAAMLQLGKWFDYMRENDVYDNTKIILVADHGRSSFYEGDEKNLEDTDTSAFYPLLMVKDFDSEGFTTSEEFMTNADVPTIAMKDIIENPINPFTGKEINSDEKTAHDQYVNSSWEWDIEINNGNTYLPAKWYSVHDDMRDINNWKLVAEEEVVLPPMEEEK